MQYNIYRSLLLSRKLKNNRKTLFRILYQNFDSIYLIVGLHCNTVNEMIEITITEFKIVAILTNNIIIINYNNIIINVIIIISIFIILFIAISILQKFFIFSYS